MGAYLSFVYPVSILSLHYVSGCQPQNLPFTAHFIGLACLNHLPLQFHELNLRASLGLRSNTTLHTPPYIYPFPSPRRPITGTAYYPKKY